MIKIKKIYCSDIAKLDDSTKLDNCFCVPLQFTIGKDESDGGDEFQLLVCSPEWLEKYSTWPAMWGRNMLIMKEFSFPQIKRLMQSVLDQTIGLEWTEAVKIIGRYAHWEFEDYKH